MRTEQCHVPWSPGSAQKVLGKFQDDVFQVIGEDRIVKTTMLFRKGIHSEAVEWQCISIQRKDVRIFNKVDSVRNLNGFC
jgi:hypothetical protein